MKKIVFLVLALAITTIVSAQTKSFKIGIKLSPSVGFLKTDVGDISTNGRPVRFGYGLIFDRMFSENYAIGFGLNMIEFGGHAEYTRLYSESGSIPTIQYVKRDYSKVKYVEMPLTLKLRTSMIGKMVYWGQFGVGIGYLLSGYADEKVTDVYEQLDAANNGPFSGASLKENSDDQLDIKSELNPFRVSMIIAAGAEYPISGSTLFSYGITYNGGLLSAYDNGDQVIKYKNGVVAFNNGDKSPVFVDKKILMNQVQLNVGIIF
ncbi:MAG: hypothetical protein RLY35_1241 [Bacteroidota bacterium]|jgi:hypothetical protein